MTNPGSRRASGRRSSKNTRNQPGTMSARLPSRTGVGTSSATQRAARGHQDACTDFAVHCGQARDVNGFTRKEELARLAFSWSLRSRREFTLRSGSFSKLVFGQCRPGGLHICILLEIFCTMNIKSASCADSKTCRDALNLHGAPDFQLKSAEPCCARSQPSLPCHEIMKGCDVHRKEGGHVQ
jgi:hypothetical protein